MDLSERAHQLEISMARFTYSNNQQSTNNLSIADVVDLEDLKEIMQPFYDSTGLGVAIFDNEHTLLACTGWQKICSHFHKKHPEANKSCAESEAFFKKNLEPSKTISFKCSNGLWDIAYPIYVDDDYLGNISFGQFFYNNEEIDKEFFINQANRFNFDKEAYFNELKQVPILSKKQVENYIQLFVKIVEKTARLGIN